MGKIFDPQVVSPIITSFIEELITTKGGLVPTQNYDVAVKPIEEYQGRMLVSSTEKLDVPAYISEANFYLNQGDMNAHRARGAMVIYMDIEVADKLFKAAGLQVPYDEDDESMEALCGSLCKLISEALKDRLAQAGYVSLEVSTPNAYKTHIPEGVEFSKDQNEKQEISFYFLKHKALVIDWTMAPIPKK